VISKFWQVKKCLSDKTF